MAEEKVMPMLFSREAVLVDINNLDAKLKDYLKINGPHQRFVKSEVEVIGAYINESLMPQRGHHQQFFLVNGYDIKMAVYI